MLKPNSVTTYLVRPENSAMDGHIDEMSKAYKSFVDSMSAYLWAIQMSSGQKTPFTNTALKNFKDRYDAFKATCDKAEDFIDTTKKRIAAEYLGSAADLAYTTTKKTAGESSGNAADVAEIMKQFVKSHSTEPSNTEREIATSMAMGQSKSEHAEEIMQMLVQSVAQRKESTKPNNAEASNSPAEKSEGSKISEDVMPDSDTTTKKTAGESSGNADDVAEFIKQLLEESSHSTEPSNTEGEIATSMAMGQSKSEQAEEIMQMLVQLVAQGKESTEPDNVDASDSPAEKSEGSKISEDVMPDSATEKPEDSKNSEDAKPDSPPKSSEDVEPGSAVEEPEGQGASPLKGSEDVKPASPLKDSEDIMPTSPVNAE